MTDYLDARVRVRSESGNTDASAGSTTVSPLATPIPSFKPPSLISTKVKINTILKSHGRPPWYFLQSAFGNQEVLNVSVKVRRRWPVYLACLCHWDSRWAGTYSAVAISRSHTISYRRFFQWKGLQTRAARHAGPYMIRCLDPCRASDRARPRLHTRRCYHVTGKKNYNLTIDPASRH